MVAILDETPRWCRVTFKTGHGEATSKFTGHLRRDGDRIRGERKDSTDAAPDDLTLSVLVADVSDIVKVQVIHPRYETWVSVPWPAESFEWDDPNIQEQIS